MRLSHPRFTMKRIVEPAQLAISLADAKVQARIDDDSYDTTIIRWVKAATRLAEAKQRRALITQTWRVGLDNWPNFDADYGYGDWHHTDLREYIRFNRYREITLIRPPLQSVSSVQYIDPAGNFQTLDPTKYKVNTDAEPGIISPILGFIFPALQMTPFCITIVFVAGYGDTPDAIPETTQQWIGLAVAAQSEYRELDLEKALARFGLGDELLEAESLGDLVY